MRKHPVVLVFNKADLLVRPETRFDTPVRANEEKQKFHEISEAIARLGFNRATTPPLVNIEHLDLEKGRVRVLIDFHEIVTFLDNESPNFTCLFSASFGMYGGQRLGLGEILSAVLPE